jgi:Lysyl oxidase
MKKQILAVAVPMLLALGLFAPSVSTAGEPEEMKPNLRVLRALCPSERTLCNGRNLVGGYVNVVPIEGRRVLQFTTNVLNRGKGPLELGPKDDEPCAGSEVDYRAVQRIYSDQDGDGVYDWAVSHQQPRDHVDPRIVDIEGGCFKFHDQHNHWHFQDFADYALHRVNAQGNLVKTAAARADKVSFCMLDTSQASWQMAGQPGSPEYPGGRCNESNPDDPNWDPTKKLVSGISVGWYDSYPYHLEGQSFDITEKPVGVYCLSMTLDPLDLLDEANRLDNRRLTWIQTYWKDKQLRVRVRPYRACPK